MSDTTTRLQLPYLLASQADKHVSVNEGFSKLDALLSCAVLSAKLTTPPSAPLAGSCYIPAMGATGAWIGKVGYLLCYEAGDWQSLPTPEGTIVFVVDDNALIIRTANQWSELSTILAALTPTRAQTGWLKNLGINTTTTGVTGLSLKADNAIFSHDDVTPGTGDMRLTLNKAATKSGEIIFQNNWSSRASVGLSAGEDLIIKTTPDGANWTNALSFNRTTAEISAVKLSLSSNLEISASTWASAVTTVASSTAWGQISMRRARGTIAAPTQVQSGDILGSFTPQGHNGTVYVQAGGIDFLAETSFTATPSTAIRFAVLNNGAWVERLRIASNGNIGIGSASPTARLDVDGPIRPKSYLVTALPAPALLVGAMIYVSNESSGAVIAFSDGTNWRRVTDRAIVT